MKKLETYLFFNGNCGEAMQFYERVLGGKLNLVRAKDTPGGSGDAIMHARLDTDGAVLMASDWMPSDSYPGMDGFSVTLSTPPPRKRRRSSTSSSTAARSTCRS